MFKIIKQEKTQKTLFNNKTYASKLKNRKKYY